MESTGFLNPIICPFELPGGIASDDVKNKIQSNLPIILERKKEEGIKRYRGQPTHHIFSLASVPNIIFKFDGNNNEGIEKRNRHIQLAREVCQSENLDALYIPASTILEVESKERHYTILAEEKLEIELTGQEKQYKSNSDKIQNIVKQLTIFICKTHFSDVEYRNIPLFTHQGRLKAALWDLEEMDSLEAGLFGFGNMRTGLMRCADQSQRPAIVAVAKECLVWSEELEQLLARL